VRHRITARIAAHAVTPRVEDDPAVLASFLSDAAHVPGGFAAGVAFPRNEAEVAALSAAARRLLSIGAQSSLTGGATPRGEVILSTRALSRIGVGTRSVRVGAGVPLSLLQRELAAAGRYYPPVPTYDGAFVGGTIATNAAGAATFKYGATRPWVEALTVVLADGSVLDVTRGDVTAVDSQFEIVLASGNVVTVPVPTYVMPDVPKVSAGYFAGSGMDLIDLFIGSEGTLGTIVEATLKVIARPRRCVALIACDGDQQAVALTAALRAEAQAAWRGDGPLDIAAIEYMDARALRAATDEAFARAAVTRPGSASVLLLVQIEIPAQEDAALTRLQEVLDACGVGGEIALAAPGDERTAQRLFELREAVPAGVNAIVAAAKKSAHPDIEKTAGDMIVPFERLAQSIALYRSGFERLGIDYAIWGHVSDGNLHANVVPRSLQDVVQGREALVEMARAVIAMGGSPLAEHGVGRSAMKQRLLRELYGEKGLEQMRAVKRALDPGWKLAPGVLFAEA
jgi:D-lactate dehydrogenase (cytochrome)